MIKFESTHLSWVSQSLTPGRCESIKAVKLLFAYDIEHGS
jgi:hypothetical protein